MAQRYTDILANAFLEVRAWRFTTITVTCLAAVLAVCLIWQSSTMPVVLVPSGLSETQSRHTVTPGEFTGTSPDYLSQVVLGDLALILTWAPENVVLQYTRFLNRSTSELYARENVRLLAEAEQHRKDGASQTFYPEGVRVDLKASQLVVEGFLVRWVGSKEVVRSKSRFTVTYKTEKGLLYVANLELGSK